MSKHPTSTLSTKQAAAAAPRKAWKKSFSPADIDEAKVRLDALAPSELGTREEVLTTLRPYIIRGIQRKCTIERIREELRELGIRVSRSELLAVATEVSGHVPRTWPAATAKVTADEDAAGTKILAAMEEGNDADQDGNAVWSGEVGLGACAEATLDIPDDVDVGIHDDAGADTIAEADPGASVSGESEANVDLVFNGTAGAVNEREFERAPAPFPECLEKAIEHSSERAGSAIAIQSQTSRPPPVEPSGARELLILASADDGIDVDLGNDGHGDGERMGDVGVGVFADASVDVPAGAGADIYVDAGSYTIK